jgi:hypothetical protein
MAEDFDAIKALSKQIEDASFPYLTEEAKAMQMEIGGGESLQDYIFKHAQEKIIMEFDKKLQECVRASLAEKGFVFDSDDELHQFAKERLHSLSFDDQPNEHVILLDYNGEDDPSKIICTYNDKISFKHNDDGVQSTYTISMG